jgi:N-acyl-D-amino-acid deacylase
MPIPTFRSWPDPTTTPRSAKGVTTELLGQDGLSYAPVDDTVLAGMRCRIAGWNDDQPASTTRGAA